MSLPLPLRVAPGRPRVVIGLDPATVTGYALLDIDGSGTVSVLASGYWHLTHDEPDGAPLGRRWALLHDRLSTLIVSAPRRPERIGYEQVLQHQGTLAAHRYGAACAVIELVAYDHQIPTRLVHWSHAKIAAVGSGRASKDDLRHAARRVLGYLPTSDEADAIYIGVCAAGP